MIKNFGNITKEIKKTGFILEFKICEILEKHNWFVINNRYYIDDIKNVEREIDILAYRAKSIENIAFYTVLLISCKKSENNVWSFLTKKYNKKDPNINFYPILNWTNVKILNHMFTETPLSELKKSINKTKDIESFYKLDKQVFAFQEMNKTSGKPQNDKNIYDSIVTIIKALEYERKSLSERKKIKAFYNFNLISVIDGEMVEINFDTSKTKTRKINSIEYLNRHIINNKEEFYKVHFIKSNIFEDILVKYNDLARWNLHYYYELFNNFYKDVFCYDKRVNIFFKDFIKRLFFYINWSVKEAYNNIYKEKFDNKIESIEYEYDKESKILNLIIILEHSPTFVSDDINDKLNKDDDLIEKIKEELFEIYKYKGNFRFSESSLPF